MRNIYILLGEDNPTNQLLIRKIVEKRGWLIDIVDNGEKVVQKMMDRRYDLVLMDVQMPIINGYEATEMIRKMEAKQGRHTPIIAVTAFAMKGDREKSIEAGMDDYISKPIRQKIFFEVIEQYLKEKKGD